MEEAGGPSQGCGGRLLCRGGPDLAGLAAAILGCGRAGQTTVLLIELLEACALHWEYSTTALACNSPAPPGFTHLHHGLSGQPLGADCTQHAAGPLCLRSAAQRVHGVRAARAAVAVGALLVVLRQRRPPLAHSAVHRRQPRHPRAARALAVRVVPWSERERRGGLHGCMAARPGAPGSWTRGVMPSSTPCKNKHALSCVSCARSQPAKRRQPFAAPHL